MKALITGITGQDGYFLSQFLLSKGYEVYGIARRNSTKKLGTIDFLPENLKNQIHIYYGDITDTNFINEVVSELKPDELYHLAVQSFVAYSFTNPSYTYDVNIGGTLNVVNAVRDHSKDTKLYFAGTSELYGKPVKVPQNEETPFYPRSPYVISKLAGFWTVKMYREAYGLFMSNGILFNHESEVRGPEFVTRKISIGVSKIYHGSNDPIELGNINAVKDWGYAKDYVEGMWKILNHKTPDDFVLGTGEPHTVREFVEEAFKVINIEIRWEGEGLNEVGVADNKILVKVNKEFFRPLEADNFIADYSKARTILGWKPNTSFKELVKIMVNHDIQSYEN
ncbi:MAG: GDP-mannose 4,6-dehydratase [Candidatus Micrarchaeaceae archaeon]